MTFIGCAGDRDVRFDADNWTDARTFCKKHKISLLGELHLTKYNATPLERDLAECLESSRH